MDPRELIGGNPPSVASPAFGAFDSSTRTFSSVTSNSAASPLIDLDVDDNRLMTGNVNKSSSLIAHLTLSTSYSEK